MKYLILISILLIQGCGKVSDVDFKQIEKGINLCIPNGGIKSITVNSTRGHVYVTAFCNNSAIFKITP